MDVIVKTRRGFEKIAASHIGEVLGPGAEVEPAPFGYLGIVFVKAPGSDKWALAQLIAQKVPEADRVLVVEKLVPADPAEIEKAAVEVAKRYINPDDTFAIRTTRRGSHTFSSIDINVRVGAAVKEVTGANVDLEEPTKPLYVEIFQDTAAVCIPATGEYRKLRRDKPLALGYLRKVALGQFVYEGDEEAVRKMGERIGRAVQTFEVGELVILLHKPIPARTLRLFAEAVEEGIESRYQIQTRSYGRPVWKVPVHVYELYQWVRDRAGEPLIVTDPKGDYVTHAKERLAELFKSGRVNVLIGAREGVPTGVFRFASLVIDLIPEVTIATDFVVPALAIGLISALEEAGTLPRYLGKRKKK
ncbi:MAG: SPOUT family RNA methylase [Pyrobaculum arsenaticum]|uniref:THUMP domain protein n=2 Tax=Pyrobaculum arsenaticum TaxID=121277 RepID=A4WLE1_PYRAR|nr:SPOUT family RNA methylase [Pyrobaculum arsenaticum]ABP51208.1 THUMP domain protein [Pyrobaculum arsenaticum DSM 13514]MCY0889975.1 SPOUT family RNA methylase [Pyrobaculum arsenaticum]NYR15068.1 SPOUT family RNA methylase [Pyrobaculum arsenaticum]